MSDVDVKAMPESLNVVVNPKTSERFWKATRATLKDNFQSVILLNRLTHPIAWVGVGIRVIQTFAEHWKNTTLAWPGVSIHIQNAILRFADMHGCGRRINNAFREYLGLRYGVQHGDDYALQGVGDPQEFIDWIWGKFSDLTIYSDYNKIIIQDTIPHHPQFHASSRAKDILDSCTKLRNAEAKVAALFYGPPGTGKSADMNYLSTNLGNRVLRVQLRESYLMSPDNVCSMIRILKPTTLILDDVDRTYTESALTVIDKILSMGVVVLASCNDQSKICNALLREDRIDLHYHYTGCPEDLFDIVCTQHEATPSERDFLKGGTYASLKRYFELRDVLGEAFAREYVEHHRERKKAAEANEAKVAT